jgi:metal-responsive CopG/Arc/MetJ family transcriptional regulator
VSYELPSNIRRPRLSVENMERVIPIRMPEELFELLEAEREARAPARPTRSQLIRELLAEALAARKRK